MSSNFTDVYYFDEIYIKQHIDQDDILLCLDEREKKRFNNKKKLIDSWVFAISRHAVKKKLSHIINQPISHIHIEISQSGKPFLPSYTHVHFNISHTCSSILIAISNHTIGVDIEHINRFSKNIKKIDKIINDSISKKVEKINQKEKAFARYWTAMEANVKYHDQSIANNRHNFGIDLPLLNDNKTIVDDFNRYYFHELNSQQICLCSNKKLGNQRVRFFNNDIYAEQWNA